MKTDRPIFVVAPPRSGTSLLYQCIASHPDVGFFNRANKKLPTHPWLAHLLTRLHVFPDRPRESRRLWFRFFTAPYQAVGSRFESDLRFASHVTPAMREFYDRLISRVLELRGAKRLASKLPAHSLQLPFLNELFPDAIFVQPIRDWRAVVSSTIVKRKEDFGGRWFGVCPPGWRDAQGLPPELGAAWQYVTVHEYLEQQAPLYPGRFLRVQYEQLCREPKRVLPELFEALGLRFDAQVERSLPQDLRPPTEKWRQHLTADMIERIKSVHGSALHPYEFDAGHTQSSILTSGIHR